MIAKLSKFSFLVLLTLSLSSCFKYEEVTVENIKSVRLIEFSDQGLLVESEIKINNPNGFDIRIVDSGFDLYVKGNKLAKASIQQKLTIPENSSDYHKIRIKSDYKDFADGALVNMLAITMGGGKEISFKAEGFVVGKVFFIKRKAEFSHQETVPLKLF